MSAWTRRGTDLQHPLAGARLGQGDVERVWAVPVGEHPPGVSPVLRGFDGDASRAQGMFKGAREPGTRRMRVVRVWR